MGSLAGFERGPGFRRRQVRTTPAAITDPAIFTAEAQAVGQLGVAVAGVGITLARKQEIRNNELAKVDFTGMKADTAAGRNEFLQSLRTTDESYDEINKRWGDFKKKLFKTIGNSTKQRKAQQAYGNYIKSTIPAWDQDIDNIAWAVSVPRAKVKAFNSAVGTLRTTADFNADLFKVKLAIEESNLFTSEEEDLLFANAVAETHPQWYLDNVDAEDTKELFELLSSDQKRTLEIKARGSISRTHAEQQRARTALETETRKAMADLLRTGKLTSNALESNRVNMSGPDYERYSNELIKIAEEQKKNQARFVKIEDVFNREIFDKLITVKTVNELDALQDTVNDYVSIEQKKLSVSEAKKWTNEIDERRKEFIMSEANSYPEWARLTDLITEVQANPTQENIEAARLEIDRAVTPPPGQDPKIVPQLARSLRTRLAGIERNPEVKKRPSLTRAHSVLGRLRTQEISILPTPREEEDLPKIRDIEDKYSRMAAELDEYADTVAGDKDFDDKINKKLRDLTRPIIEDVTLGWLERILLPKRAPAFIGSEERLLIKRRLKDIEDQPAFKKLTSDEQQQTISLIESGLTVEEAVSQIETGEGRIKGTGFFGELELSGGDITTEFSIGVEIDDKEIEIPTLVPTLTKAERDLMINDIIPNRKKVPDAIVKKATVHAKKRIKEGKSPFAGDAEQGITATNPKTGERVISFDGGKTWQPL